MTAAILTLWTDARVNDAETIVLRKPTLEMALPFSDEDRRDVSTLLNSFLEREDALGLAAPQIGINKRIIAFRTKCLDDRNWTKEPDSYAILVNPRITQTRGELEIQTEGCLSCPDIQVEVPRFPEIKVRAYDLTGRKINERYQGFLARVVQHELDHLDGRLVIDYEGNMYFPRKYQAFFSSLFARST